jgi:hypothetical protein
MERSLDFPVEVDELKSIGSGKGSRPDFDLVQFPERTESLTPEWKLRILQGVEEAENDVAAWKKLCAVLKDRVVFQ